MATAPAQRRQELAVSSPRLPGLQLDALPVALTEARQVEGFRNPQWSARALVPSERIAVQQSLVTIDERLVPAKPERLLWHLGRLAVHWKNNRTDDETDLMFDDYAEDLAEYSEAHIAEVCREWRRTKTWFPKIAELVAMLDAKRFYEKQLKRRARVLLGLEEPRPWERIKPPEEEAKPLSAERRFELEKRIDAMGGPLAGSLRAILAGNVTEERRLTHRRKDRD